MGDPNARFQRARLDGGELVPAGSAARDAGEGEHHTGNGSRTHSGGGRYLADASSPE